jgi:hypothetical protein
MGLGIADCVIGTCVDDRPENSPDHDTRLLSETETNLLEEFGLWDP